MTKSFQMGALNWYLRLAKKRMQRGVDLALIRKSTRRAVPSRARFKRVAFAEVTVEGVRCEVVRPQAGAVERVLVYLHGGGYFFGSPATHRHLSAELAVLAQALVVVPDYRLAPEHPFPSASEDAVAVWRGLGHALPETAALPRCLGGDSAGGGLALALLQSLRDAGAAQPSCAVLYSPWLDLTQSGATVHGNARHDAMIWPELLDTAARWYAGACDLCQSAISPLFGDMAGLAPLRVYADRNEVLADDTQRLERHLHEAGGDIVVCWAEGLIHAWPVFGRLTPESRSTLDETAHWMRLKTRAQDLGQAAMPRTQEDGQALS